MADSSSYQFQHRFSQIGSSASRSSKEFKRTYQACLSCRKTKAKCELIDQNAPCTKCQRERRECVFTAERSVRKKRNSQELSTDTPRSKRVQTNPNNHSSDPMSINRNNASIGRNAASSTDRGQLRNLRSSAKDLENDRAGQNAEDRTGETGLDKEVMRTVVSSSNDALGLLFRAAEQQDQSDEMSHDQPINDYVADEESPASVWTSNAAHTPVRVPSLSSPSFKTLQIWEEFRFVKMGWFSSREAVTLVDLFFNNLYPFTPVLTRFFSKHENHAVLASREPLLCCTILMISSRHHILPGSGGLSRAQFIHTRLWKHCEHLVQRITFGQEKYYLAKTRTLGSIEALLLMTEWHPRALHFPPEADGWDASLAPSIDESHSIPTGDEDGNLTRWREEVFDPAKRSDRMSWMILGLATTLAFELGVFENPESVSSDELSNHNRARIRKLLFIYVNQLASRLGCSSLLPQSAFPSNFDSKTDAAQLNKDETISENLISLWIDITKLLKTATEMFFSSRSFAASLIQSGRYVGLLEHFQPLLAQWQKKFQALKENDIPPLSRTTLSIEYQYLRMYINSLAIQALVAKANSRGDSEMELDLEILRLENRQDYKFTQEVTEASAEILQSAISLADDGVLLFAPIRVLLRITSASIFLLKAISLGARNTDLQKYLDILDRCILALRSRSLDDMHLSARYATLIERLVKRFRRNFRVHSRLNASGLAAPASHQGSSGNQHASSRDLASSDDEPSSGINLPGGSQAQGSLNDSLAFDDWLAQPFDPCIAPFGFGSTQTSSGFELDSLDFLWSIEGLKPS